MTMPNMNRHEAVGRDLRRGDVIEVTDDGEKHVIMVLGVEEPDDEDEITVDGVTVAIDGVEAHELAITVVHAEEPVTVHAQQHPWDWSADYARRAAGR